MDEKQAQTLARTLFAYYPNTRTDDWNLNAYASAFADMDVNVVRAAITRVTRTLKFLPTVAELCAACVSNARGERRSGEEAYAEVMVAVRRFGRVYGDDPAPEFLDPLIAQCLAVWGSWNDVCNAPDNDPSGRMRFVQLYDQLAARGDTQAVLPDGLRKVRQFGFAAAVRRLPEAQLRQPPTPAELAAFDGGETWR